jgi:DNA topoisomerase IB
MSAYWKTLSHNGVNFPDPYAPEGLSIKVRGKQVPLSPLAEEMGYNFAKKKDTPYVQDPVFRSNFMKDFVRVLPPEGKGARFEDIDFGQLYRKVDMEKAAKEAMTKEQKKALASTRKEKRDALKARYGRAVLDGKEVDIANWMVEPPGLFMGRGQHPFRGKWKPRVGPSDVVLNLGESAAVPPGDWKQVVHDHDSMWMAKWVDKLTGKEKYVWLHESSPLQQSRSKAKYDKALKVGSNLEKIKARIQMDLNSKDERIRQVATVCYLIDTMGMRVGDEKDDDEADTVGASTLRVEHVKIEGNSVKFDFLGKDSVSGSSELYYRIGDKLCYGTIKVMAQRVAKAGTRTRDTSGREVIVPKEPVKVLTVNDLVQHRSTVTWTDVNEILVHEVTKPLFDIVTSGGRNIRVTGDHSLFYSLNGYRAGCAPVGSFTSKTSLATVSFLPAIENEVTEVNGVPITEDFLTFAGLWLADGCHTTKGLIISAGNDDSVVGFIDGFSHSYYGAIKREIEETVDGGHPWLTNYTKGRLTTVLHNLEQRDAAFHWSVRENGDVWIYSVTLMRMMKTLEFVGDSHTKTIPEWVMCLSQRQLACFLKGYFSGDGFVASQRGTPTSGSVNLELSRRVQTLLLRLGIDSTLTRAKGGGFGLGSVLHVVRVDRANERALFADRVGLLQSEKQAKIRNSTPRYRTYGMRWRRIRKLSKVQQEGRVYDLSTGNERFVVNNLLAHNSVRWEKVLSPKPAETSVIRNLREFMSGKSLDAEIFHDVSSSLVNQYLSSIAKGATAKVFRTYHATATAKGVLESKDLLQAGDLDKVYHAKEANLQAAIFCNHQRTPPKTWEESHQKKVAKLQEAVAKGDEKRIERLKRELEFYERTKNYNLNTSMKNYIDPRVFKSWCDYVGLDWAKIYSKSLQKKFAWVQSSSTRWEQETPETVRPLKSTSRPREHAP